MIWNTFPNLADLLNGQIKDGHVTRISWTYFILGISRSLTSIFDLERIFIHL